MTNLSIEANSVDSYQTAPIGAVWYGSTLFVIEANKTFCRRQKQMTFVVIGALRIKTLHTIVASTSNKPTQK